MTANDWLDVIADAHPRAVFTHPYGGGHPDHDATAFAVHAACAAWYPGVPVLEMTPYHQGPDEIETGVFLTVEGCADATVVLITGEIRLKEKMLECFKSQAPSLQYFEIRTERFRAAPSYDFEAPPHPGTLYYENYNFGMSGKQFRLLADHALQHLP